MADGRSFIIQTPGVPNLIKARRKVSQRQGWSKSLSCKSWFHSFSFSSWWVGTGSSDYRAPCPTWSCPWWDLPGDGNDSDDGNGGMATQAGLQRRRCKRGKAAPKWTWLQPRTCCRRSRSLSSCLLFTHGQKTFEFRFDSIPEFPLFRFVSRFTDATPTSTALTIFFGTDAEISPTRSDGGGSDKSFDAFKLPLNKFQLPGTGNK